MNDAFLDTKFYLENWKENAFKRLLMKKMAIFLEYLLVVILIFCLIISTE